MLTIQRNNILVNDFSDEYEDIIFKRLRKVIHSGLSKTKTRKAIKLSVNEKRILLRVTKRTIRHLILAKPNALKRIIKFLIQFPSLQDKTSNIYKILYNVFVSNGYDNTKMDKFQFIKNIGLKSCVYCNRTYIFTINKSRNLKPEIDHFYPKSIYPYLAMSYYNLIPSCPTCNGLGAKGSRDSYKDKVKNPYSIEDGDFKFTFDIDSISIVDGRIDDNSIDIKLKNYIKGNDEYFQLSNLYQEHRDIVIELYQKIYQENTREHFKILSNSLEGFNLDEDEIYKLITCGSNKDVDFHKRPLSKLIKDISQELGLL